MHNIFDATPLTPWKNALQMNHSNGSEDPKICFLLLNLWSVRSLKNFIVRITSPCRFLLMRTWANSLWEASILNFKINYFIHCGHSKNDKKKYFCAFKNMKARKNVSGLYSKFAILITHLWLQKKFLCLTSFNHSSLMVRINRNVI